MILIDSPLLISFRTSHSGTLRVGCVMMYRKHESDSRIESERHPADYVNKHALQNMAAKPSS
jgi:hypothetical protein